MKHTLNIGTNELMDFLLFRLPKDFEARVKTGEGLQAPLSLGSRVTLWETISRVPGVVLNHVGGRGQLMFKGKISAAHVGFNLHEEVPIDIQDRGVDLNFNGAERDSVTSINLYIPGAEGRDSFDFLRRVAEMYDCWILELEEYQMCKSQELRSTGWWETRDLECKRCGSVTTDSILGDPCRGCGVELWPGVSAWR